jgi:hypothetical protein
MLESRLSRSTIGPGASLHDASPSAVGARQPRHRLVVHGQRVLIRAYVARQGARRLAGASARIFLPHDFAGVDSTPAESKSVADSADERQPAPAAATSRSSRFRGYASPGVTLQWSRLARQSAVDRDVRRAS